MATPLASAPLDSSTNARNTASTPAKILSPKMQRMLGTKSPSAELKREFYGTFEFFDSQPQFDAVFGIRPNILCHNPLRTDIASVVKNQLRDFSNKCKLDVFLHISNLDYVGSDASGDENLSTLAVCRQIQTLKQQNHTKGRTTFLSPEILSNQFSSLATNLPDNART